MLIIGCVLCIRLFHSRPHNFQLDGLDRATFVYDEASIDNDSETVNEEMDLLSSFKSKDHSSSVVSNMPNHVVPHKRNSNKDALTSPRIEDIEDEGNSWHHTVVENPVTYLPRAFGNNYKNREYSWDEASGTATANIKGEQRQKQPLNFLHIPMTTDGDNMVETAAARAGISWGRCVLEPSEESFCPPTSFGDNRYFHNNTSLQQQHHCNNTTSQRHDDKDHNPYTHRDVFVIVRNPYSRAVASVQYYLHNYNCRQTGMNCINDNETISTTATTAEVMNQKIQQWLKKQRHHLRRSSNTTNNNNIVVSNGSCWKKPCPYCLWIPQYDFMYDITSNQDVDGNKVQEIRQPVVVKHVLQWEYLMDQFPSLMKAYGLEDTVILPPEIIDNNNHTNNNVASSSWWWWDDAVADLTTETRKWIEQVYSKDFGLGGYVKISHVIQSRDPHQAYLPVVASKASAHLSYSWNDNATKKKRRQLGFLHIPKTGGSSIENAAGLQGIRWGMCLFTEHWSKCPPGRDFSSTSPPYILLQDDVAMGRGDAPFWHVPIQYLPVNRKTNVNYHPNYTNPYANQDIFVVIRNPYKRAVSEYYYYCNLPSIDCFNNYNNENGLGWQDTADAMNKDIQLVLQTRKAQGKPSNQNKIPGGYFMRDGHWVPQYDFVYDDRNTVVVDIVDGNGGSHVVRQIRHKMALHVIHFEYLTTEFPSLMNAYGLDNVKLTSVQQSWDRSIWNPQQTVADLTPETRVLIEEVYEKDFELGGYIMLERSKMVLS
jgi:hypothetical protein